MNSLIRNSVEEEQGMNKVQLIGEVAKKTGLSKAEASAGVNAMIDLICGSLSKNEKVTITGSAEHE